MSVEHQNLPQDVAGFIDDIIDSVEQLDVLLHVRGRAAESWTGESVARELRIEAGSAARRLEKLAALRLLAVIDGRAFRYAPSPSTLESTIGRLAACYAERRVTVIAAIFAKPRADVLVTDGKAGEREPA